MDKGQYIHDVQQLQESAGAIEDAIVILQDLIAPQKEHDNSELNDMVGELIDIVGVLTGYIDAYTQSVDFEHMNISSPVSFQQETSKQTFCFCKPDQKGKVHHLPSCSQF